MIIYRTLMNYQWVYEFTSALLRSNLPTMPLQVIMNDTSDENSMEAPTKKTTPTLYNINIVHTLVKTTTHEQGN